MVNDHTCELTSYQFDLLVVMATTGKTEAGKNEISAFVMMKDQVTPVRKIHTYGMRASDTAELIFEDCEIPLENLVGKEGDGFIDAMRVLDGGRISIAALALGMAQGAYESALKYSKQRKQFGKAISEFQAIQWKLADMATEIDAARLKPGEDEQLANERRVLQNVTRLSEGAGAAYAALYDALGDSLVRLKQEQGRRVVVVMTDGRDEDNHAGDPGKQSCAHRQAVTEAFRPVGE